MEGANTKLKKIVCTQVTKVRNFPRFSNCGDFLWRISEEFLENQFLHFIPRKFSRNSPELVPKMRDFCGITVLRLSFEKFPRNSSAFFPTKFLRISPEIPEKFIGLDHHVYRFLWEFIKRISFGKFLVISPEFHPKKILRI